MSNHQPIGTYVDMIDGNTIYIYMYVCIYSWAIVLPANYWTFSVEWAVGWTWQLVFESMRIFFYTHAVFEVHIV